MIRGGDSSHGIWAGAVWRPAPGKRGAAFHAALVERPGCRIRRLAGRRSQEMRFRRLLHNPAVTADEMVRHACDGTAARVAGRDIVVAQDTSELALGGRRARASGYGPVGKGGALGGLLLHAAVALEIGTGALLAWWMPRFGIGTLVQSHRGALVRRKIRSRSAGSIRRRVPARHWRQRTALLCCRIGKATSTNILRAVRPTRI